MSARRQAEHFRSQAEACARLGSAMYADLLARAADDLESGGPVRAVTAGHEHDPGPSALALRLLGSVHRLVLQRRAGALATFYPSVGGTWEAEHGWAAFAGLLAERPEAVREWLGRAPQTNEVGRAAALLGGLRSIDPRLRRPVRLFEIGASAGLNLLVDHYASDELDDDAWRGRTPAPWPDLAVLERCGSDVHPVDVSSTEGRLTLTAYVWPDQHARLERLRAALEVAQRIGVEVREQGAADFVDTLEVRDGTLTVLWHSVMWQYLGGAEQARVTARIAAIGATATASAPFAHVFLEPTRRAAEQPHEMLVVLETWPDGGRRILGRAEPHGVPTTWE